MRPVGVAASRRTDTCGPRQCFSIYYMLLSRKPLSHPRKKYGKGVLVATSLFTALHIANIATHVRLCFRQAGLRVVLLSSAGKLTRWACPLAVPQLHASDERMGGHIRCAA